MVEANTILQMLQYADSFFPAGGTALSWGVEPLFADGEIGCVEELKSFVAAQLRFRWASFDRHVLRKAHGASLHETARLDRLVESLSLVRGLREGSVRSGQALLGTHARLKLPGTAEYRDLITARIAHGHLCVMQALVFSRLGLPLAAAEAMSVHLLVTGFASAAVRLSRIGATDAQEVIRFGRETAEAVLAEPCADELPFTFQPCTEIACMRHERRDARLFSN